MLLQVTGCKKIDMPRCPNTLEASPGDLLNWASAYTVHPLAGQCHFLIGWVRHNGKTQSNMLWDPTHCRLEPPCPGVVRLVRKRIETPQGDGQRDEAVENEQPSASSLHGQNLNKSLEVAVEVHLPPASHALPVHVLVETSLDVAREHARDPSRDLVHGHALSEFRGRIPSAE